MRPADELIPERDSGMNLTGRMMCMSCHLWNCWHQSGESCDIRGCQCVRGVDDEVVGGSGSGDGS